MEGRKKSILYNKKSANPKRIEIVNPIFHDGMHLSLTLLFVVRSKHMIFFYFFFNVKIQIIPSLLIGQA